MVDQGKETEPDRDTLDGMGASRHAGREGFDATLDGSQSASATPTPDGTANAQVPASPPGPPTDTLELGATLDGQSDEAAALAHTLASSGADASFRSANLSSSFPVAHWDRYEFIRLLGRGGMGAVYQARDKRLGRMVALKFITSSNPQTTARFVQEARAQSRIDHPNVCKVYEVGEVAGQPYIAMQLLAGESLDHASGSLSRTEKVQLLRDVARAIHTAHELGIIHRDLLRLANCRQ